MDIHRWNMAHRIVRLRIMPKESWIENLKDWDNQEEALQMLLMLTEGFANNQPDRKHQTVIYNGRILDTDAHIEFISSRFDITIGTWQDPSGKPQGVVLDKENIWEPVW